MDWNLDELASIPSKWRKPLVSVLLTAIILAGIFAISPPASAVSIDLTVGEGDENVNPGESVTFTSLVCIQDGERIPADEFWILVQGPEFEDVNDVEGGGQLVKAEHNGTLITAEDSDWINVTKAVGEADFGYGYLSGYDEQTGDSHSFGYGYGYGSDRIECGEGFGDRIAYEITIDTTDFDAGTYGVTTGINEEGGIPPEFQSNTAFFNVTASGTGDGTGPGTGAGAGGGAGAPPPSGPGQPNMTIVQASASPNPVEVGEEVTLSALVENQGDVYGTLEVQMYVDGEPTGETHTVALPAESNETVTVTTTAPAPGEYSLHANDESFGPLVVEAAETPAGPTATAGPDTDTPMGPSPTPTETDQPGFGIVVAVVALLAAALLARRRD